jgi:hypothetical protein
MLHLFRDSGIPVTTRTIPGVVLVELPTSRSPAALNLERREPPRTRASRAGMQETPVLLLDAVKTDHLARIPDRSRTRGLSETSRSSTPGLDRRSAAKRPP